MRTITVGVKWARARNHGKMRIAAMLSTVDSHEVLDIATESEKTTMKSIKVFVAGLLKRWDGNNAESKRVYLSRNIS